MLLIILTCTIIGIVMAMITQTMYNEGIFIDELITGTITITDLMFAIVFLWVIAGVILGASQS